MSLFREISHIKSDRHELKKFGLTFGIGLFVLSVLIYWMHRRFNPLFLWQIPVLSILLGLTFPVLLWPFQKIWMTLGIILGFIMTRVLLSLVYYLVLTPIGLIARLFGNDFLHRKLDPDTESYWNYRQTEERIQKIEDEKARLKAEQQAEEAAAKAEQEPVVEEAVSEEEAVVEAEPVTEEPTVEEPAAEVAEVPASEVVEEPAAEVVEEPVAETQPEVSEETVVESEGEPEAIPENAEEPVMEQEEVAEAVEEEEAPAQEEKKE